jgi:chromosome segregation ATPase
MSSPEESQFFPAVAKREDPFTSPSVDSYVDKMIVDLREQNKLLKQELDSTQKREVELGKQIESSQDKLRKEMIKLDSTLLQRVEDVRDDYERQIVSLKEEISSLREANEKLEQHELESALVRKEELELAQARLAATEEKLELCKERVKETSDIKNALLREEKAHSASVEECHRLKNELKTIQTLKNELEKQKTRAVDAESELTEREEDLVKLLSSTQEVEDRNKKLTRELSECKEEAEDLRRQLAQEEQSTELCARYVAEIFL